MKITYLEASGLRHELEADKGMNAMQLAVNAGLHGIVGECGGSAMCATCHVYVVGGPIDTLPPMNITEDSMLEATATARKANSRLSCQILLTQTLDGLQLQMPESQT